MVDSKELNEAIELLYFGYRQFTEAADRILERRGLGRVHHRILYFVGRHPGLSVGELLNTLQVSKQALNTPLRQLIGMELIRRDNAAHDARVKQLHLTAAGKRLEAALTAVQQAQLTEVFDAAGPQARQGWRAVMRALAAGD